MLRSALFATTAILVVFGAAAARANNVFTGLGDLPGGSFISSANAVSADGSTVVGYSESASGTEAFRWTSGTGMVGLADLPGGSFNSRASGVSGDGAVVVGINTYPINSGIQLSEAFIWDESEGMRSLQEVLADEYGLGSVLTGWLLENALGISADGKTIVGWGTNPDGKSEAWLARLDPPMVAALPIIAAALGGFGFAGWRQQRKPA